MMLLSILAPTIRCIWHLPSWKEALVTTVSIDNGTKGTPSFINIKLRANGCIEQLPTLLALEGCIHVGSGVEQMQQLPTMLGPAVHCGKDTTRKTLQTMCNAYAWPQQCWVKWLLEWQNKSGSNSINWKWIFHLYWVRYQWKKVK